MVNERATKRKRAGNVYEINRLKESVTHSFYWWPTREYFISLSFMSAKSRLISSFFGSRFGFGTAGR